MDAGFWVASEGRQRLPGGGIAGATGSVSPAGVLHAVDSATERVACGHPLAGLIPFQSIMWTSLHSGIRCRACVAVLAD